MNKKAPHKHPKHPIDDLIEVMRALRTPKTGCPWDLEQDFKSIAPHTIEEAYEVADAIERGNMDDLREELGDLLFQPVYHAQMAAEAENFDIYDVIKDITQKMISRHPHVFGDGKANSASDVNKIWDERKAAEKKDVQTSVLGGVAKALPALLRAQKLQNKAAKVGFEWPSTNEVFEKLDEELGELKDAMESGNPDEQAEELGDVLFVIANLGRMLEINPETALRHCNDKFERRFKGIERDCEAKGVDVKTLPLDQLERMWVEQKRKEV